MLVQLVEAVMDGWPLREKSELFSVFLFIFLQNYFNVIGLSKGMADYKKVRVDWVSHNDK